MAGRKPKTLEKRKSYKGEKNLIFSQRLRERRLELSLNQSELAEKMGILQKQISMMEGGAFVENAERLIALARALETTPDYLFGFREEP